MTQFYRSALLFGALFTALAGGGSLSKTDGEVIQIKKGCALLFTPKWLRLSKPSGGVTYVVGISNLGEFYVQSAHYPRRPPYSEDLSYFMSQIARAANRVFIQDSAFWAAIRYNEPSHYLEGEAAYFVGARKVIPTILENHDNEKLRVVAIKRDYFNPRLSFDFGAVDARGKPAKKNLFDQLLDLGFEINYFIE